MTTMTNQAYVDDGLTSVLDFLSKSLRASASVIYWIESSKGSPIAHQGYENAYFEQYNEGAGRDDPIAFQSLVRRGGRLAYLSETIKRPDQRPVDGFMKFMSNCGFADAMTIILREAGQPLIGVGVMKTHEDPPMSEETECVAGAIQSYLEGSLIHNPSIKQHYVERKLHTKFGLSKREREVVGLIADGASNYDIAVVLGISEATVKTHIQRSFDKLGVSSRTATMRLMLQPDQWITAQ
ncbi:response regulator transcription factor [Celeribacter sp.]|uniref:helix-turn-helix transcriptional regulator n=1 Tax=Celeribacter sp. TaxID=1890673 RepID=UPI003A95C54E